jgi:hypothetical protein
MPTPGTGAIAVVRSAILLRVNQRVAPVTESIDHNLTG